MLFDIAQKQIDGLAFLPSIVKQGWIYLLVLVVFAIYFSVTGVSGKIEKHGLPWVLAILFFVLSIQNTYDLTGKLPVLGKFIVKDGKPTLDGNLIHAVVFMLVVYVILLPGNVEGFEPEKEEAYDMMDKMMM